jgi:hypothetical protein
MGVFSDSNIKYQMMVRNGPIQTAAEDASERCRGACAALLIIGLIIGAFVALILYLQSQECQVKPWKCGNN